VYAPPPTTGEKSSARNPLIYIVYHRFSVFSLTGGIAKKITPPPPKKKEHNIARALTARSTFGSGLYAFGGGFKQQPPRRRHNNI